MRSIAMIPARMGSQRLPQKNLQLFDGLPLLTRAIRTCRAAAIFDEVWVNSEHPTFGEIAATEGVLFHPRPDVLATSEATSEAFVAEFLEHHETDVLYQIHSIAPLLTVRDIRSFSHCMLHAGCDTLLSVVDENLECIFDDRPVNFSFAAKTNSQDLRPVRRIVWAMTAWRRQTYLDAFRLGACATFAGKLEFFPVDRRAGHVIKTLEDLKIAEALLAARDPDEESETAI